MNFYVFKKIYICRSVLPLQTYGSLECQRIARWRDLKLFSCRTISTVIMKLQFLLFKSNRAAKRGAPIFTKKKSCIEIGLEVTQTIVQIQQFFFNSTALGKIEEQNWVERQNGAASNLFSHKQNFLEMNLEEMPLKKLLKIQQILSIKLIRLKWVKSNCKIVWSGKTERRINFSIQ